MEDDEKKSDDIYSSILETATLKILQRNLIFQLKPGGVAVKHGGLWTR